MAVRVYVARIEEALVAALLEELTEAERAPLERIARPRHRGRHVLSHGMRRRVLGELLGARPAALRFEAPGRGKPRLHPDDNPADLRFNVSHSGDVVVLAVAPAREVGVDVEEVVGGRDWPKLAARFFAPGEQRALAALPDDVRARAYWACWTRKEALIKAVGLGLAAPLDGFEVEVDPRLPPRLLSAREPAFDPERLRLLPFDPPGGYAGALAVEGEAEVSVTSWP